MKKIYKKLIKILNESDLTKIEYEENGKRYLAQRNNCNNNPQVVKTSQTQNIEKVDGIEIIAPIIGSFYEGSAPGKKPFVKVGDKVKKDQTLFILEAMKVMNEIKAPCNGVIKEIKFKDGDLVEFGETIMIVG